MKNIVFASLAAVLMLTGCEKASDKQSAETQTATQDVSQQQLDSDKIYFFYSNTCPHCHDALEYLNNKYPDLELTMVNVGTPDGYNLLIESARKFNLGNMIGTPLFVMGDNHLMGWAPEYEAKFDAYVRKFQENKHQK